MLPGKPDLILDLPVSDAAIRVGGYINDARPHCVNHMIIGTLGTHEVLLMACDDGDVLAYYVSSFATRLAMDSKGGAIRKPPINPFFHENVGMSAWGLALHEDSRLIAVSSNRREVTVFIPAISESDAYIRGEMPTTSYPEFDLSKRMSFHTGFVV